ncbi:MAG: hypothetical protein PHC95_16055, partial [Parabacteroides sp.]|nr:hypothetical protein [Parabacteroides sp.]
PGADGTTTYTWIKYSDNADGTGLYDTPTANTMYIGIAVNKTTPTESPTKTDYVWSKFKGDQGVQGPTGATLYTWIKYASYPDGHDMSNSPTGMTYIGLAYNKTTATESIIPTDYTWSLIKGDQGVAGAPGADGTTTYTWIKYSDNADGTGLYDTPTANTMYIGIAVNKTTPTESPTKTDYVWSKFKGDQGVQGPTGVTLYTWIKYATSSAGAGLSDNPAGMTYIGLAYNKTTATESDDPSLYTWSLIKGEQGVAGAPGANGTTTYTWIKYSDNADGTGLYDTPTVNTMYIGIAVNKTTPTESPTKTDYVWSKFKGDQGVAGANGTNGINAPQPNLINFSGEFLDTTGWSAMASGAGSAAVTYNNTTGPNLRWVYLSNIPSSLQSGGWLALRNNTNLYLVAGRTYTLTLKIRTDALLNYFQIVIGKNDNSESAYTSTVIQQDYSSPYMTVVRTFTAPTTNSSPYYFRIIPSNLNSGYTSLGVYSVKLEEGTTSTPWIESETDKSVAATPYRDVFSITKTYTGNKLCRDVVYNGNAATPVFYIANRDAGTFSGKDLSNYQYWTPFSANFENIATGLLLAVEAYIQNLIAGKLKTAASGARTEIDGDTNTIRIYDSNNKLIGAIARVVGVGGSSFTFFGNDYQGGVAADSIYIQDNDQVNYPVKFDAWLYNHVLKLTCQGLEGKSSSVGYTPLVLGSNGQIRSGLEYDTLIFTDSSEQSLNRWQRMVLASNASNRILYLPYTDGMEAGHQIVIRKKAAGNIIINPVSESILLTTADIRTSISVTGSGTLASLIWDGQYWCFNQQTY